MNRFDDEEFQKQLNKRAIELLNKKFNNELETKLRECCDNDLMFYLDSYEENIDTINKYLDYLFLLKNKEIESLIWNSHANFNLKKSKYKSYFENARENFRKNRHLRIDNKTNLTLPIKTKRCVIKPITEDDVTYLLESLEKDNNDFKTGFKESWKYYGYSFTKKFAIYSIDNKIIGEVGLSETTSFSYDIEYYILPYHRNNGYITEVLEAIIDCSFGNRIISYVEDDLFRGKFNKKVEEIKILTINIETKNEISNKIPKKFNFVFNGIIKEYTPDKILRSNNRYTLTKYNYYCGKVDDYKCLRVSKNDTHLSYDLILFNKNNCQNKIILVDAFNFLPICIDGKTPKIYGDLANSFESLNLQLEEVFNFVKKFNRVLLDYWNNKYNDKEILNILS